jgi:hypothetical protein
MNGPDPTDHKDSVTDRGMEAAVRPPDAFRATTYNL